MKEFTHIPEKRDLAALQEYQRQHDAVFHSDVFQMETWGQLRHVMQHLTMIVGEMARYCDRMEHRNTEAIDLIRAIRENRIPDLLAYALKLSNLFDDSLEATYLQRIQDGEVQRIKQ